MSVMTPSINGNRLHYWPIVSGVYWSVDFLHIGPSNAERVVMWLRHPVPRMKYIDLTLHSWVYTAEDEIYVFVKGYYICLSRGHFYFFTCHWNVSYTYHIHCLVQDSNNSNANALELLGSCTKPPICYIPSWPIQMGCDNFTFLGLVMHFHWSDHAYDLCGSSFAPNQWHANSDVYTLIDSGHILNTCLSTNT